mmetsp:Transcript_132900/g.425333  ORF Transcript_132900/g.425333 Transcript_132900/m.425333 type:complete len:353 (-) Transcript_132900:635-1693(-)
MPTIILIIFPPDCLAASAIFCEASSGDPKVPKYLPLSLAMYLEVAGSSITPNGKSSSAACADGWSADFWSKRCKKASSLSPSSRSPPGAPISPARPPSCSPPSSSFCGSLSSSACGPLLRMRLGGFFFGGDWASAAAGRRIASAVLSIGSRFTNGASAVFSVGSRLPNSAFLGLPSSLFVCFGFATFSDVTATLTDVTFSIALRRSPFCFNLSPSSSKHWIPASWTAIRASSFVLKQPRYIFLYLATHLTPVPLTCRVTPKSLPAKELSSLMSDFASSAGVFVLSVILGVHLYGSFEVLAGRGAASPGISRFTFFRGGPSARSGCCSKNLSLAIIPSSSVLKLPTYCDRTLT